MDMNIIETLISFGFSAVTALFAIIFWSKTRDLPWILVIIAVLFTFAANLYSLLVILGIGSLDLPVLENIDIIKMILNGIPSVCFILAFIAMIRKRNDF